MKTIFLGTPELAVPFLEVVAQNSDLALVVCNPDQPAGRSYAMQAPPVKTAAELLGVPIEQPKSLTPEFGERLAALSPDLGVVVAYGRILPKDMLLIPRLGFLNVHFSLLPKYRGAAPMQWSLINGEKETGVTLFWLDEGMDTGPIFSQMHVPIADSDNADSLQKKLVPVGLEGLKKALAQIESGQMIREPQTGPSSLAPMLTKDDGRIRWTDPAPAIVDRIRGTVPWPGAFCSVGGLRIKVIRVKALPDEQNHEPGTITRLVAGEGVIVKCGRGQLKLLEVQPDGKRPMRAWDWWQGARLEIGDRIT